MVTEHDGLLDGIEPIKNINEANQSKPYKVRDGPP